MYKLIALAATINKHINNLCTNVWPGFTPVPFILYNDNTRIAVGDKWPKEYIRIHDGIWAANGYDSQLMGNTAITYHGIPVAIWDTRTWPCDVDIAQAASSVAHEMFHAFQWANMAIPHANELLLPQYPHSALSVALIIEENMWLAQLCKNRDMIPECLVKIAALRRQREAEVGTIFMEYDKYCESEEGTAAYFEVHTEAHITGRSPFECAGYYSALLQDTTKLLPSYRHRCYAAGLILCLACDIMWPGWQTRWQESGRTIFDWIAGCLTADEPDATISPASIKTASGILAAYRKENEQKISRFMSQPLASIDGDIRLLSFDPMNLVCSNGRCLHIGGRLCINGEERVQTAPFLTEYGDTILDIKRFFYRPDTQK